MFPSNFLHRPFDSPNQNQQHKEQEHKWNGDKVKCPKTGEERFVGVYTSGKTCPDCGASLRR